MTTEITHIPLYRTQKFHIKKQEIRDLTHLALLIKESQEKYAARKKYIEHK